MQKPSRFLSLSFQQYAKDNDDKNISHINTNFQRKERQIFLKIDQINQLLENQSQLQDLYHLHLNQNLYLNSHNSCQIKGKLGIISKNINPKHDSIYNQHQIQNQNQKDIYNKFCNTTSYNNKINNQKSHNKYKNKLCSFKNKLECQRLSIVQQQDVSHISSKQIRLSQDKQTSKNKNKLSIQIEIQNQQQQQKQKYKQVQKLKQQRKQSYCSHFQQENSQHSTNKVIISAHNTNQNQILRMLLTSPTYLRSNTFQNQYQQNGNFDQEFQNKFVFKKNKQKSKQKQKSKSKKKLKTCQESIDENFNFDEYSLKQEKQFQEEKNSQKLQNSYQLKNQYQIEKQEKNNLFLNNVTSKDFQEKLHDNFHQKNYRKNQNLNQQLIQNQRTNIKSTNFSSVKNISLKSLRNSIICDKGYKYQFDHENNQIKAENKNKDSIIKHKGFKNFHLNRSYSPMKNVLGKQSNFNFNFKKKINFDKLRNTFTTLNGEHSIPKGYSKYMSITLKKETNQDYSFNKNKSRDKNLFKNNSQKVIKNSMIFSLKNQYQITKAQEKNKIFNSQTTIISHSNVPSRRMALNSAYKKGIKVFSLQKQKLKSKEKNINKNNDRNQIDQVIKQFKNQKDECVQFLKSNAIVCINSNTNVTFQNDDQDHFKKQQINQENYQKRVPLTQRNNNSMQSSSKTIKISNFIAIPPRKILSINLKGQSFRKKNENKIINNFNLGGEMKMIKSVQALNQNSYQYESHKKKQKNQKRKQVSSFLSQSSSSSSSTINILSSMKINPSVFYNSKRINCIKSNKIK